MLERAGWVSGRYQAVVLPDRLAVGQLAPVLRKVRERAVVVWAAPGQAAFERAQRRAEMLLSAGVSAVGIAAPANDSGGDVETVIDAALQDALLRALPQQGCRGARPVLPRTSAVDAGRVLTRVTAFLTQHLAAAPDLIETMALWCLHAWCVRAPSRPFELSPRLILHGEDARADHARALRILAWLTPAPLIVSRTVAAHVLPMIASEQPTLLFDDIAGGMLYRRDMRTLIAAGAMRDGIFLGARTRRNPSGRAPCFAPTAVATTTPLPEDVRLRSIVLRMPALNCAPRPTPGDAPEEVLMLRSEMQATASVLVRRLVRGRGEPPLAFPPAAREKWYPLLAVGEAIGAEAGAQAALAAQSRAVAETTTAVSLLQDLHTLYRDAEEHIPTVRMIEDLAGLGRADRLFDPLELARRLHCFGLKPVPVRLGDAILRGYRLEELQAAFARYLITFDAVTSYGDVAAA